MVETEVMVEILLVIILTVIDIEVGEVIDETHSMVMDEEVEMDDVQDEDEVMVETQCVDADEMVETLEIHTPMFDMIELETDENDI
jgi:hypothetical protein